MSKESQEDPVQYWKSKHREVLRDLDTQETIWRELEKVLRRLVTRLCIAASGTDPRLDTELTKLSAAIKRDAAAAELQSLFDSVSKAIVVAPDTNSNSNSTLRTLIQPVLKALKTPVADDAAKSALVTGAIAKAAVPSAPELVTGTAVAPAARRDVIIEALGVLLQRLNPAEMPNKAAAALLEELPGTVSDATLAQLIERAADLVRERGQQLMRERRSAATLLTEVTTRLNDVAAFIASGDSDVHASREAGESLNTKVMSDVRQLSDEAKSATDLGPLRQLIAARVDSISSQVRVFRDREEARFRAHAERTAKLSQQVKDLTSKSATLESDLEKERQFARIDALTGVANRAAFDERLREEIARLRRSGTPVSMLCWDLDHFKSINDQFGHVVGDRVLKEVAACFVGRMRSSDFIARLGGEEFVTLLIGTAAAGALKVADDLRQAVADLRMHCRGTPVTVTVSCGITQLLGDDDSEAALERADAALYRAKDSGRNTCIAA